MRYFASLNENNICSGIQTADGDVIGDNIVDVTTIVNAGTPHENFMWRKFDNGQWSIERFEPSIINEPSKMDIMQQQIDDLTATLGDYILGGM